MYVRESGVTEEITETDVRCPYCKARLYESSVRFARVKRLIDGEQALLDHLPPTHRALTCGTCKQTFTTLKV